MIHGIKEVSTIRVSGWDQDAHQAPWNFLIPFANANGTDSVTCESCLNSQTPERDNNSVAVSI